MWWHFLVKNAQTSYRNTVTSVSGIKHAWRHVFLSDLKTPWQARFRSMGCNYLSQFNLLGDANNSFILSMLVSKAQACNLNWNAYWILVSLAKFPLWPSSALERPFPTLCLTGWLRATSESFFHEDFSLVYYYTCTIHEAVCGDGQDTWSKKQQHPWASLW